MQNLYMADAVFGHNEYYYCLDTAASYTPQLYISFDISDSMCS